MSPLPIPVPFPSHGELHALTSCLCITGWPPGAQSAGQSNRCFHRMAQQCCNARRGGLRTHQKRRSPLGKPVICRDERRTSKKKKERRAHKKHRLRDRGCGARPRYKKNIRQWGLHAYSLAGGCSISCLPTTAFCHPWFNVFTCAGTKIKFRGNAKPSAAKEALTPPCGTHLPPKPAVSRSGNIIFHAVVMRPRWHTQTWEHDTERAGYTEARGSSHQSKV